MNLYKKTFVFISVLIGASIFGVYVISRTILVGGFEDVELRQIERNLERVRAAIDHSSDDLKLVNSDWAYWDESYEFVNDKNEEFVESTLNSETLMNLNIHLISFLDVEGESVYTKLYEPKEYQDVDVPKELKNRLTREDKLVTHVGVESVTGLISTPNGTMIVSSYPIFKSDRSGHSRGTIIMGRFISEDFIEKINRSIQFPVTFIGINESPFSFTGENTDKFFTDPVSESEIIGYVPIEDLYGNNILIAKVQMPREVYQRGNVTLSYFILAIVAMGVLMIAGGVYFQSRWVLAPIHLLTEEVDAIRAGGNLSSRVTVEGQDEISSLASNVNAMLAALQELNLATAKNEKELASKLVIIEKQNRESQKAKLAMMNLLEDAKELEDVLRKEHDRLNLIISSMGEGLLVIDNNFVITTVNPVAQKLLGLTEKESLGKKWSDITTTLKDGSKTPLIERSFSKAISEGKITITSLEDNHYYRNKLGKEFPIVSITAPLRVQGKIVGAVKVFKDATAEKNASAIVEKKVVERTKELQKAKDKISEGLKEIEFEKARLTSSINSLNVGFVIADKAHKIIVSNPVLSEILKVKLGKLTIEKISDLLGPDVNFKNSCIDCVKNQKAFGRDDIIYKDKFLRLFMTPVVVGKEAIGYVILVEDVTAQKLLERSKDEFFAVASHELRTPLTAIRGNTSLIMDYYADKIKDSDLKEMIGDMHESSVRLINIVNDFLDASRLEQGRVEFKKEPMDIADVTQGVIGELKNFAKERGINIEYTSELKKLTTKGDRDRSWQVVHNLVANAVKFTKKGSVKVGLGVSGNNAVLRVKDTGVGISPANQRLLFKKFQQAGERVLARDVTKGTGMGLYISKLLAQGMGGKVYLEESKLGEGSVFTFELPIIK